MAETLSEVVSKDYNDTHQRYEDDVVAYPLANGNETFSYLPAHSESKRDHTAEEDTADAVKLAMQIKTANFVLQEIQNCKKPVDFLSMVKVRQSYQKFYAVAALSETSDNAKQRSDDFLKQASLSIDFKKPFVDQSNAVLSKIVY